MLLEEAKVLASCSYENHTKWGEEVSIYIYCSIDHKQRKNISDTKFNKLLVEVILSLGCLRFVLFRVELIPV